MATLAPKPRVRMRADRIFYSSMGVLIALIAFAGFARSYYLVGALGPAPYPFRQLNPLLHVHGIVFTAWVLLMVVQPLLIAANNRKLHRTLGYSSVGLAAAMVLVGNVAAVEAIRHGFAELGDPAGFYAVPFFSINSFAVFFALAIHWRDRAELHKRMILIANIGLIGAPLARIPLPIIQETAPLSFVLGPFILMILGIAYDLWSRGRVHRAWLWGGGAMLAVQLAVGPIMGNAGWLAFARYMGDLWPA